MQAQGATRADRKRRTILEAATTLFLSKGYDRTSMDDVALLAGASKPTVYKYFADKEQLFSQIVLSTTDEAAGLVEVVTGAFTDSSDLQESLRELARQFIVKLMEPDVLRLRRLVIATAERFPDVGRTWYEQGFERALDALAGSFAQLAAQGRLKIDDPRVAASHYVGLLLWIPVNRVMFSGANPYSHAELDRFAEMAVEAFLRGYGVLQAQTQRP
jgi:TetR/AcrR family transcriptional repressor of mexJK operon